MATIIVLKFAVIKPSIIYTPFLPMSLNSSGGVELFALVRILAEEHIA